MTSLARISVKGVVQGVGFRPFVYRLATERGLKGYVQNTSESVLMELEGPTEAIEGFLADLKTQAPPMARVESVSVEYKSPVVHTSFEIRESLTEAGKYQAISPDIATCQPCVNDFTDPANRRHGYPFTNCTNCGPRFTIIEDMPYDRPNTTMRSFTMCPNCRKEYEDPLDRRFHAQPNACPVCGPRLTLVDAKGKLVASSRAISAAVLRLKRGGIVGMKGLGGFLLACDATNEVAVNTLRQRKKRPYKPFAVMLASVDEANVHCTVSEAERAALTSSQAPIVLLRWMEDSKICRAVAPGLKYMGVMLPYTPLHHLILLEVGLPLVMTSGNLSEEPIAKDNDEALRRLAGIADYFLLHDRDIASRYDDSVVMLERGETQVVRRSRGYAPYPVHLKEPVGEVLAVGAEDKVAFCATRDNYAFVSQHIGDMENLETLKHFESTLTLYRKLFRLDPRIIVHDLHPDYLTTKWAQETARKDSLELVTVQHHHAHIAGCMADNWVETPVIGVAFDGTGYGSDGRLWGGEFFTGDFNGFKRVAHLEYLPLPGGAAAIKLPYRTAAGYLIKLLGESVLQQRLDLWDRLGLVDIDLVKIQVSRGFNSPLTSSMGRLFDAVAALAGVRHAVTYEGQAAVELEMAAYDEDSRCNGETYLYSTRLEEGVQVICLGELLSAIIVELCQGVPASRIAARFHNTVAGMVVDTCKVITRDTGIRQVALSGGVFQNRLLLSKVVQLLERSGLEVLTHRQVPCNDGGISLGQAVLAKFAMQSR